MSPTATPSRHCPLDPTLAVRRRGGRARDADAPVVQPLVQSVTFVQEIGTGEGLRYPRYGNTPNAEVVQRRLAMLEGAEAAVLLERMGATACALLALLRPGDHLLASSWIYGGTHRLLTQEFATLGIDVTLVDPLETRGWRKRLRKETRAIFVESPVNPTCRVLDLRPISYLTKEDGLALVVDSTFASPINFRPLEHGADVVIHSATKYLNGHHDVIGGAVFGTAPYVEEVRQKMMVWGQAPDPFACWLLERGLKTLDVRVRGRTRARCGSPSGAARRGRSAGCTIPGCHRIPITSRADEHRRVRRDDGHRARRRRPQRRARLRRLQLIRHAPSLGGVDSLVSEPRFTSHARSRPRSATASASRTGSSRLSVGIEDADDLIADLEQAFK